ncbi:MAG: type IV secretory system conjugative DNA transfer family protein, partial [Chloroflexota bacterium]|nr:type IV secretory system conjugative DNA transfer family protein [Chloroflexota bacterium]
MHDTIAARSQLGVADGVDRVCVATRRGPRSQRGDVGGARRTAVRLLEIGQDESGSSDERFWRPAGARYLAPLLFAAERAQLTMGDVLSWIATTNDEDPRVVLEQMHEDGVAGAHSSLEALQQVWEADARTRSSLTMTATTALDAWQEPSVAAATGGPGAIDARWLLGANNTLYLSAPADDQKRLRGLFTALVAEVVAEAFARATRTGRAIDPPLLLCLDECANVAPLRTSTSSPRPAPGRACSSSASFRTSARSARAGAKTAPRRSS